MKELKSNQINKQTWNLLSPIQIERKIAHGLRNNKSQEEILDEIRDYDNQEEIARFLYNTKNSKKLLEISKRNLMRNRHVAWSFVLPCLIELEVKINASQAQTLFQTWLKDYAQNHPAIFACKKWEVYSSDFSVLLDEHIQEMQEKNQSEEDQILEEIVFLRSQNLLEEESRLIKDLLDKHPNEEKYKKLEQSLKQRKAEKIIEKQRPIVNKYKNRRLSPPHLIMEDTPLKRKWSDLVHQLLKKQSSQYKNLAIFLYFLGWPDETLKILKDNIKEKSDYWLYMRCLMDLGQYTRCLDLINQLLIKTKDYEDIFPLIYIKSQALYNFGKTEEAISYLKSILKIRPDYKNAQFLLEKWTQE